MKSRAELFFDQLKNVAAIKSLLGKSEDVYFDCKEWPSKEEDAQRILAKAACGLTNAEGGVLLIGVVARSLTKDDPDVVQSFSAIADTTAAKSRVLDLIGQLVEPGIKGVRIREVAETKGAKNGYLAIYVPASEGPPRRSRKDWKFYLRIGTGTFPMEYFQIEDAFGRRPHAKLELYFEWLGVQASPLAPMMPSRFCIIGLRNVGRGVARYPAIQFSRSCGLRPDSFGIDGSYNYGLPLRPTEADRICFQGGADNIIYPGETVKVCKLIQDGSRVSSNSNVWYFPSIVLRAELFCEGTPRVDIQESQDGERVPWAY